MDGGGVTPRQGEIWHAHPPSGSRPWIVVSADRFNRGGYLTVVPITSKRFEDRKDLPNCVPLRAGEYGLSRDSVVQAEGVSLIERSDLELGVGPIDQLDPNKMREVIKAIGYVLDADCEPCTHFTS